MADINEVVALLGRADAAQAAHMTAWQQTCDTLYFERANRFLTRYERLLQHLEKDLDYGVECFRQMTLDMIAERAEFIRNGCYSNSSFADVNRRLYDNPMAFEHHMHGLALAQFLWWDQYQRFDLFSSRLRPLAPAVKKYLEIGAGHGLYIHEALSQFGPGVHYDAVDVSPVSLEMTRIVTEGSRVNLHLTDILEWNPDYTYDFITIGEVVEHLEDPFAMLNRLRELLSDDGVVFLTTPANAPMIDHIYLFHNAQNIRDYIHKCGFRIVEERAVFADNMSEKRAIVNKVPLMFAAFLKSGESPGHVERDSPSHRPRC